jgi:hypothetical protein
MSLLVKGREVAFRCSQFCDKFQHLYQSWRGAISAPHPRELPVCKLGWGSRGGREAKRVLFVMTLRPRQLTVRNTPWHSTPRTSSSFDCDTPRPCFS